MRGRVGVAAAAIGLGLVWLAPGCSDDSGSVAADGGAAADADVVQAQPPPTIDLDAASPRADCLASCADEHPAGKAKDDLIGTCWTTSCAGRCTDDPVDAAGVDDSDAGDCQSPVNTDDIACDQCTRAHCCAAWDGCFGDADCQAFDDCENGCPAE